jgi:hypothetical protein
VSPAVRIDVRPALAVIQQHVGGCREELHNNHADKCWKPAEYILWGKLIPAEGLGPRCHEHALRYVSHYGLSSRANYALVHLADLAYDVTQALAEAKP